MNKATSQQGCKLTLPLPPSANRYWRSIVRGSRAVAVLSADARAYKERASQLAAIQHTEILDGNVSVDGVVYFPNKRGDLDNRIKPVLDSLSGVTYHDDRQVVALSFRRAIDKDNPRVEVTVREAA